MGFSIDYGIGTLGAVAIVLLISTGLIVLFLFLSAVKRARDDVVEAEGDDPDILA